MAEPGHLVDSGRNATILGAAANVIVVEKGLSMGVEVRLWDFVKPDCR
jgi:Na+/H+ antiporter NhaD/arsenite permease-like protein